MARIKWDEDGKRLYETGTDNGVLYLQDEAGAYTKGEGWDGLTGVSENPDGATTTAKYANNNKYGNLVSQEQFKFTISAFIYPDSWEECDGSAQKETAPGVHVTGQTRKTFGMTYRTMIGNDTKGDAFGYTLHLVYGATAAPSKRDYQTVNETPDMMALSWDATTVPVPVPGMKPSAHIRIKSTEADPAKLAALEDILYGKDAEPGSGKGVEPRLPLPAEVFTLMVK